jgi:hypothetical protein
MRRLFTLVLVGGALAVSSAAAADVRVLADAGWTSTGFSVDVGQTYSITSLGRAFTVMPSNPDFRPQPGNASGRPGESGPEGQIYICTSSPGFECALDGAAFGELVGRVDGEAFAIGDATSFTAPTSGTLELAVNDFLGYYADNSGGFTITLR